LLNQFTAAQKLATLITSKLIPSTALCDRFIKITEQDKRGFLLNDIWAAENSNAFQYNNNSVHSSLEKEVFDLLKVSFTQNSQENVCASSKFYLQDTVTRHGVVYSSSRASSGNSFILFGDYPNGRWYAGQITSMFVWERNIQHSPRRCFAVIDCFRDLLPKDCQHDLYCQYSPNIAGRLVYAEQRERTVVPLEKIICHFAATSYSSDSILQQLLHVLPLDKVRIRPLQIW
jgi:hypothetical protein